MIENLANFIATPEHYEDPHEPYALTQEEMKQAVIDSLTRAIDKIKSSFGEEDAPAMG